MTLIRSITGQVSRLAICQHVMEAAEGMIVRIGEPTRSLEQNAKLHALLNDIAESEQWAGQYRDIETWKRLMTAAWIRTQGGGAEILPAVDGHGFDVLYRRTSSLTVREMIELIDYVESWFVMRKAEKLAA